MLIKAAGSDCRRYLAVGADDDAKEHPEVRVTIYGAASEKDVDEQVVIPENFAAMRMPDILAATSTRRWNCASKPCPLMARD